MSTVLIFLTILIPWSGAVCVWLVGDKRPNLQHTLAAGFSLLAGVAALALIPYQTDQAVIRIPFGAFFGDLTFVPDGLGVFLAAVATVIGSLAVIFSRDYMHGEAQLGRYYAFVLFFIGAMVGLVLTGSFLFLFFFWEITALCSYVLISFYNDDPKAVAGGIKALVMTQIGGVGLLGGALIAHAYLGSFDISVFLEKSTTLPVVVLALMAFGFLIAAAAKSAQLPFQTWLPDAMEAPTPISALIHAATMVNAGVYLLARFYPAFAPVSDWKIAVIFVGAITALLAAVMALVATDLKRVLAYSTVSQLGYMVYAVGAGGILASQLHLFSHAVFKALLFLAAGAIIHAVGTRDMRKMGGLAKKMPFVRNVFLIGALALAGLPPLNGFWSKEFVLESGLEHGPQWAYALVLFGAGLTACYTFRMVWMVFYAPPEDEHLHIHDAPLSMKIALAPLALGALSTWLLAGPFMRMLAETLPFHHLEAESTVHFISAIVTAPWTWAALAVVAAGLAAWRWRNVLAPLTRSLSGLTRAAQDSFGFEWVNRQVVEVVRNSAETLRAFQTGQLNWNIFGMVAGLLAVLIWLALGS